MLFMTSALLFAIAASSHSFAQPAPNSTQSSRTVPTYLYFTDTAGDKVLLSTQFWRNDPKYDDRAFHRFLEVMSALEKRGFTKNEQATVDSWEKPESFVRCYIYLEDLQAGTKSRGQVTSGSRINCTDNGASERELRGSDSPKHVDQILHAFDEYFERAKKKVHKTG
jgi:hypothetical protein